MQCNKSKKNPRVLLNRWKEIGVEEGHQAYSFCCKKQIFLNTSINKAMHIVKKI
jgi:hypothetical protein